MNDLRSLSLLAINRMSKTFHLKVKTQFYVVDTIDLYQDLGLRKMC